jgi:hypothetical protein
MNTQRSLHLAGLEFECIYTVEDFDGEVHQTFSGCGLVEVGIPFSTLKKEESALLRIY